MPILLVPSFTFPYNIFYYQENGLFCACINRNSTVVCSSKFSGGQCDLNFQLTKVTIKNTALDFRLEYLNYFIQFKQSYLIINQSDFFSYQGCVWILRRATAMSAFSNQSLHQKSESLKYIYHKISVVTVKSLNAFTNN